MYFSKTSSRTGAAASGVSWGTAPEHWYQDLPPTKVDTWTQGNEATCLMSQSQEEVSRLGPEPIPLAPEAGAPVSTPHISPGIIPMALPIHLSESWEGGGPHKCDEKDGKGEPGSSFHYTAMCQAVISITGGEQMRNRAQRGTETCPSSHSQEVGART